MTLSLYDISVPSFKQALGTVSSMLNKAEEHFNAKNIDLEEVLDTRLHEDMRPLRSQLLYVVGFTLMTLESLKTGEFVRSNNVPHEMSFSEFKALVESTIEALDNYTPEIINACIDNEVMIIKLPDIDDPFTASDFVLSFGHPNVYFHASTIYDILRMKGLPLEKLDIIGEFRSISP